MKILGIDPGSINLGFGLIEIVNYKTRYLTSGTISPPKDLEFYDRLKIISKELQELMSGLSPDEVVLEKMFFAKNASVALKLGEVRGVIFSRAFDLDIPTFEYSVKEVKKHITGYGSATKEQMQDMVRLQLGLSANISTDASDAISLAIYRAQLL